jgi:hypothetical protein
MCVCQAAVVVGSVRLLWRWAVLVGHQVQVRGPHRARDPRARRTASATRPQGAYYSLTLTVYNNYTIVLLLHCLLLFPSINNTMDTGSASQEHKSPLQGMGCIHRHKSQFNMTVYNILVYFCCQVQRNLCFMLWNQDLN